MIFEEYIKKNQLEIEPFLINELNTWRNETFVNFPTLDKILEVFITGFEGGKRLRAILVRLGYEVIASKADNCTLLPAIAYEIFQTSILAHDDIIDESPLRRGKETIYKSLERLGNEIHIEGKNYLHYGISQTICVGDVGLFLAIKMLAKANVADAVKTKSIHSFIETLVNTGLGEMLDVELPYIKSTNENLDEAEDIMRVYKFKTARYTITGPLQLGAILAGSSDAILQSIVEFGDSLGVAFQIKDDVIGIFSSEGEIGKSVTSDIEEGKKTLLYNYAMLNAKDEDRLYLEENYGKWKIDSIVHERIKEIFTQSGAKSYCENLIINFAEKGKKQISKITNNEYYSILLAGVADYLVGRTK